MMRSMNYFISNKLCKCYLDGLWNGNHQLYCLNIKTRGVELSSVSLCPAHHKPLQHHHLAFVHKCLSTDLYAYTKESSSLRTAETGAYKDKITCLGLLKSLWKKETHFPSFPILSHPHDINNNFEVVYSKPKYLKPYVNFISAHMTWETKIQTSQVEAITQINTIVPLHKMHIGRHLWSYTEWNIYNCRWDLTQINTFF